VKKGAPGDFQVGWRDFRQDRRVVPNGARASGPLTADANPIELGRKFELSGKLIRNAVLTSALKTSIQPGGSRKISQKMLEHAASDQLLDPENQLIEAILESHELT
jgi:hypothetical protein